MKVWYNLVLVFCIHNSEIYITCTDNPFYTDTRYNNKNRYNDNLTITKPSLKRWQFVTNCARILYLILKRNMCFGYLLESPEWGDSNKYPKRMFCEEVRIKQDLSCISICLFSILYNSKFILLVSSLGTNTVFVTRIHCISRPRWLSWMRRPTGGQEVAGSTPAEVGNILSWRLIVKYFLRSFSPFRWFKKGSCQFLAKDCAQYWLTA